MTLTTRFLIVLAFALSLSPGSSVWAQYLKGTISYKILNNRLPDSGAKIYLCPRGKDLGFDGTQITLKEKVLTEYELSLTGSAKQMSKHKKTLIQQYHINGKADLDRYIADAAFEEAKIISAQNVQLRIADNKGDFSFDIVSKGNYIILIRSRNTDRSCYNSIDVSGHDQNYITRTFGE